MLDLLQKYIKDGTIVDLIKNSEWDSLLINRRKPHTYRLFTYLGDYRICLHKFEACAKNEAFYHPHPWPGAFYIGEGSYQMDLGLAKDKFSKPEPVCRTIISAGSMYEITSPLTFHSVVPLTDTYTIMVNDLPFNDEDMHVDVKRTKGKDLEKLDNNTKCEILSKFQDILWSV